MQLRAYLQLVGQTYSEMARKMGFSQAATVQRHAEGTRRPDAIAVEKYRKATDGAVTAQDWHELALQVSDKPTKSRDKSTNGGSEADTVKVKAA